jgi:DNA mismatch repair protein MutS
VTELESDTAFLAELERLRPAEIICPAESGSLSEMLRGGSQVLSPYDDWVFAPETAQFTVREHFKVSTLDGFGLKNRSAAIGAAGAALHYLTQNLRRSVEHITALSCYQPSDFLVLDSTTLRHLEILEPLHRDAPRNATLYGALNRTVTPMGARRLRDWLSQPLSEAVAISRRQHAVQALIKAAECLEQLRMVLGEVRDLERTIGRLSAGSGNARDLIALRDALEQVPKVKAALGRLSETSGSEVSTLSDAVFQPDGGNDSGLLEELARGLTEVPEVVDLIGQAITDEPPLALKEGGLIRDGFDPGARRIALRDSRREGLDRATAAGGNRKDRDHVAEDPVQLGLWLLHRGDEIEPRQGPGALRAQTDDRKRRAFFHAGVEGDREQNPWSGRAQHETGI